MGIAIEMRATVLGFAGLVASASAFAPAGLPVAAKRTAGYTAPQMGVKTGINGFGRIGRQVARIIIESDDADLLQINAGSATPDYMAYQYKYDSIHGRVGHEVAVEGDDLILKGKRVVTTRARDPAEIGWTKTGVEYLCESTGVFLTEEKAKAHVDAGVKKVIFSAPAKDDSPPLSWVSTPRTTRARPTTCRARRAPPTVSPPLSSASTTSSASRRASCPPSTP